MKYFTNYHLALSKENYEAGILRGLYAEPKEDLSYSLASPTYKKFQSLLSLYGAQWDWDKRPKYRDEKNIKRRLGHRETRLFVFYKGDSEIGYCLVTAPDKFRGDSHEENLHIIEIENLALAEAYTGKGYGRYFLQEVFSFLFQSYGTVYLSSRSTNHAKVISFYQKMGMTVIHAEKNMSSDLAAGEKISA